MATQMNYNSNDTLSAVKGSMGDHRILLKAHTTQNDIWILLRKYYYLKAVYIAASCWSLGTLTLLPMGGGGFLSHTTIVLAATLKPLKLWLPNFVTSCFYFYCHNLRKF